MTSDLERSRCEVQRSCSELKTLTFDLGRTRSEAKLPTFKQELCCFLLGTLTSDLGTPTFDLGTPTFQEKLLKMD